MFVKLDDDVIDILCCPLCRGAVEMAKGRFVCKDCGTAYSECSIAQERDKEYVFDFRIHRPTYCIPTATAKWAEVQEGYKKRHRERRIMDNLTKYLDEINSVKEIYTEEFHIKGKVLDIGGAQGRLRHFLKDKDTSLYISVDPYPGLFQDLRSQPNLLKAYPCLHRSCNFLSCYAENLPFAKNTFDWVHMRSVLDHFQDPYLALKEAYRVLKSSGTLLIGTAVREGKSPLKYNNGKRISPRSSPLIFKINNKIRREGLKGLARAMVVRMKKLAKRFGKQKQTDDHMFHWDYKDLIDLLHATSFDVVKEHWQKPPFTKCIYLSAKKGL